MKTYTKGKAIQLSKNFNSTEFDCKCGKYCNKTLIDSKLVTYLQLIRDHFGQPITVTSAYRCSIHNKNVGGVNQSKHCLGMAADIVVKGVSPKEVAKYAESIGIKGIGLYSSFVHIDTRGSKSFWLDHAQTPVSTFGKPTIKPSNTTTNKELTTANKIVISLPTLQTGDKNKYVSILQALLDIGIDGVYGKDTRSAVEAIQKEKGITIDGVCGKDTWTAAFN